MVALASPSIIKRISDYAGRAERVGQAGRLLRQLDDKLYPDFDYEVRKSIASIIPTHSVSHRVRGAIHKETVYGKHPEAGTITQRVALTSLTEKDLPIIRDAAVREAIVAKLDHLGRKDFKLFDVPANLPRLTLKDGTLSLPIRKVCLVFKQAVTAVGTFDPRRVVLGNNHHMEIFEVVDEKGKTKWVGQCVSLYEASLRLRDDRKRYKQLVGTYEKRRKLKGERTSTVVSQTHKEYPNAKLLFTLAGGDIVRMTVDEKRGEELFIVRAIGQDRKTSFVRLTDARMKKELIQGIDWINKLPNPLYAAGCRKVQLTTLGEERRAND